MEIKKRLFFAILCVTIFSIVVSFCSCSWLANKVADYIIERSISNIKTPIDITLLDSQKHFAIYEEEIKQIIKPYNYELEFVETELYYKENHAIKSFSERTPDIISDDVRSLSECYVVNIDDNQQIKIFLENHGGAEFISVYYNFLYKKNCDINKHLEIVKEIMSEVALVEFRPSTIISQRANSLKNIPEKPQSLFFDYFHADVYIRVSNYYTDYDSYYFLLLNDDNVLEERISVSTITRFALMNNHTHDL